LGERDFTWSCEERKKTKEGKRYTEDAESTEGTEKKKWRSNLA